MYPERYRKADNLKAPRMRFQTGSFIRNNKTKELFCITLAYRLISEPSVWQYELESRKDLSNPETPLSIACKDVAGSPSTDRVIFKPIRHSLDDTYINRTRNDYRFGDSITATTKELLNGYTVISSGEINTSTLIEGGLYGKSISANRQPGETQIY